MEKISGAVVGKRGESKAEGERGLGHPNTKRRSDSSEAEFIARAAAFNFRVAKPWGDDDPYDVVIGFGREFLRVQVKCAMYSRDRAYHVKGHGGGDTYTKDEIDFLAGHVVPENIWYIVPVEAFQGKSDLTLYPHGTGKGMYKRYREAWCLLACEPKARGWKDIPVLCRCKELAVRCAVCPRK